MAARRTYPVQIARRLDPADLATCPDDEADRGEDEGFYGNQHYRDLRGVSWDQVVEAVRAEAALFERFMTAADLDLEAEHYEEERGNALFPEEDHWGLDVGVIGATLTLSALGCTTISSCNAGGFGGHHVAAYPYVAFFLPLGAMDEIKAIAEESDVGLDLIDGGIARIFGRTDHDLHRFAETALLRRRAGSAI